MDTVELNGEGFTPHVKAGDIVKKGDLLCEVDTDAIRQQQKSLVSPVIFTSGQKITLKKQGEVKISDQDLIVIE